MLRSTKTFPYMIVLAGMTAGLALWPAPTLGSFAPGAGIAFAQEGGHTGGGHGSGGAGGHHEDGDDTHEDHAGSGGQQGVKGQGPREQGGGHGGGLEDEVFRGEGEGPPEGKGQGGPPEDRGPGAAGGGMGDLYGDMWIILRDDNGVPILNEDGFVQPLDADGNLIPLDEEGMPLDESLTVEVELSRLNMGRSPSKVLDQAYDEAIASINAATSITQDDSGRLVLVIDGEEKTIDAPLENLALYQVLLNNGYLPDLNLQPGVDLGDLAFIADPDLTMDDLTLSAALYAAAGDKTTAITVDSLIYMNAILGIDGSIVVGDDSYVDFSNFTYDRATAFPGSITYVTYDADGNPVLTTETLMEAVFDNEAYSSSSGVDGYAQLADDSRAVIDFIHSVSIPE